MRRGLGFLRLGVGFVLCSAAALSWGQATTAPAAEPGPPTANPARPTITNPATITPVGYLQFEQGYLGSLDSPETASQYGINQTIKLAVHPRLMLEMGSQPFAVSTVAGTPGTAAATSRDAGDVLVGAQTVLYFPPDTTDEAVAADISRHAYVRSALPTVAAGFLQRVHTGTTADIDLGSMSRVFLFLFSGHAPGVNLHYDINLLAGEQPGDSSLHAGGTIQRVQFGQTLSVNRSVLNPNFQLGVEFYRFSQPLVHRRSDGTTVARANLAGLLFTPSYQVRPNLILDCGFEHGLTSTSTQWQSFAGFTYVFPHRLWARKG